MDQNRSTMFIKSFNVFDYEVRTELKRIFDSFPNDKDADGAYVCNITSQLRLKGCYGLANAMENPELERTYTI